MGTNTVNLCRICLESGAKLSLFDSKPEDCSILSKLTLCLNEKIEDIDGYPRSICKECNDTIDIVCTFINKYKETCTILQNGLLVVKDENYFSDQGQSEVEIEIDNIKNEPQSDDNFGNIDSDNLEESLPLVQLKLKRKIKKEPSKKVRKKCPKELTIKAKSTRNDINKIASSILEGDFAWIGDVCIKSTKPTTLPEKKHKPIPRQKELKIVKPREPKLPKPPPARLCDLCGEIFKDQDKLNLHKKKVHYKKPIKCPECPRLLVSQYYLNRHMKRRHDANGRNFICSTCGAGFAFKGEMASHNRNVHNKHLQPKKVFACKICNKTYKCAKSVVVHERSVHTGQRPAVCDICGTSFYHEDYLKEHRRLHTGETPFKCPICGRGYAQRCNMKSHLRIHRISELDANTLSKLRPNYLKLLKV
ncbi:uncharacterized protein [Epargyreus clarus]|uniref:uncharacterized protein isoform X2 n=1 Tax=Epargyreus clarus TaxID=520877 RepID=UPI003C2E4BE4